MQTERVTILMTPERKGKVASRAASRGISVGEYLRRKIEDDDDELTPEQEAELEMLVREANEAIPKMVESLDQMIETVRSTREGIQDTLKQLAARE